MKETARKDLCGHNLIGRISELDKLICSVVLYTVGAGTEFIARLEAVVGQTVGQIMGKDLVKNKLIKLNKEREDLSADDCKVLIQNIIQSISLFATNEEAARVQSALDKLFKTHFSK